MRQISIDTKFHHHSPKDLTISRGKAGVFNMTFRNESFAQFGGYVGFYATKEGNLRITCGNDSRTMARYKLSKSGNVPNRYVSIGTTAHPDVRKAIDRLLRDKDFINLDIDALDDDKAIAPTETETPPPDLFDYKTPVKKNVETFRDGDGLMVRVDLLKSTPEVRRFFLESLTRDDLVNECLYLLDKLGGL